MLEVIGGAVVLWLLWKIGVGIARGIARGLRLKTMMNAQDLACDHGVPREFAQAATDPNYYHLLRSAHAEIVSLSPDIRTMDVYEQYATTIVAMYKAESDSAVNMERGQ